MFCEPLPIRCQHLPNPLQSHRYSPPISQNELRARVFTALLASSAPMQRDYLVFGQQLPYAKENNFQTGGFLTEEPENRPISRLTKHLSLPTLAPHLLLLERELFISECSFGWHRTQTWQ